MFSICLNCKISKQLTKGQTDDLKERVTKEFNKLPEEFFGIGEESAELFGEGFMQQLSSIFSDVKVTIFSALDSVSVGGATSSGSGNATSSGSGGVVNNFTQNNYSPQPLNRTAIYRQTKNILGFAGGTN